MKPTIRDGLYVWFIMLLATPFVWAINVGKALTFRLPLSRYPDHKSPDFWVAFLIGMQVTDLVMPAYGGIQFAIDALIISLICRNIRAVTAWMYVSPVSDVLFRYSGLISLDHELKWMFEWTYLFYYAVASWHREPTKKE